MAKNIESRRRSFSDDPAQICPVNQTLNFWVLRDVRRPHHIVVTRARSLCPALLALLEQPEDFFEGRRVVNGTMLSVFFKLAMHLFIQAITTLWRRRRHSGCDVSNTLLSFSALLILQHVGIHFLIRAKILRVINSLQIPAPCFLSSTCSRLGHGPS